MILFYAIGQYPHIYKTASRRLWHNGCKCKIKICICTQHKNRRIRNEDSWVGLVQTDRKLTHQWLITLYRTNFIANSFCVLLWSSDLFIWHYERASLSWSLCYRLFYRLFSLHLFRRWAVLYTHPTPSKGSPIRKMNPLPSFSRAVVTVDSVHSLHLFSLGFFFLGKRVLFGTLSCPKGILTLMCEVTHP